MFRTYKEELQLYQYDFLKVALNLYRVKHHDVLLIATCGFDILKKATPDDCFKSDNVNVLN